jgi:hypothetical protein
MDVYFSRTIKTTWNPHVYFAKGSVKAPYRNAATTVRYSIQYFNSSRQNCWHKIPQVVCCRMVQIKSSIPTWFTKPSNSIANSFSHTLFMQLLMLFGYFAAYIRCHIVYLQTDTQQRNYLFTVLRRYTLKQYMTVIIAAWQTCHPSLDDDAQKRARSQHLTDVDPVHARS